MEKFRTADVQDLEAQARGLEEREASEVVFEGGDIRVMVGARISAKRRRSLFIELSMNPVHNRFSPDIGFLKKQYMLVKELQSIGYSLFQEGALIVVETRTTPKRLDSDLAILHEIIKRIFD